MTLSSEVCPRPFKGTQLSAIKYKIKNYNPRFKLQTLVSSPKPRDSRAKKASNAWFSLMASGSWFYHGGILFYSVLHCAWNTSKFLPVRRADGADTLASNRVPTCRYFKRQRAPSCVDIGTRLNRTRFYCSPFVISPWMISLLHVIPSRTITYYHLANQFYKNSC